MPLRMVFNSCVFDHPRHSAYSRYHFRSSLASASGARCAGKSLCGQGNSSAKTLPLRSPRPFPGADRWLYRWRRFIHLRKFSGENFRKFSVHDTVIGRFFNVHGFSCNLRCRAWDVLLFYHISTVFRTLTRFSSQGLNGKYEACFVEANFIST